MQKSILDKKEREKERERERAKEAGEIGSDWVHALRAKDYFIDCPIRSEGQAIYRIKNWHNKYELLNKDISVNLEKCLFVGVPLGDGSSWSTHHYH